MATANFNKSVWLVTNTTAVDTGHFFNTSLIQGLVFKGIVKGQESKVWAFFKGLRSFRGPQKQNWKNDQNSIIFGAKIKVRINFIWEKLMEFLLLNEVLKNLIKQQKFHWFSHIKIRLTLIFAPKMMELWSFFLSCFWGPLKLLRPLKKAQILDSWH